MKVSIPHANAEAEFPDDMNPAEVTRLIDEQFPEPPNHDDLENAAVTGEDSLDLQDIDPAIKPAVKMTLDELKKNEARIQDKLVIVWQGVAYVIDPAQTDPEDIIDGVMNGNDSRLLGYPEKGPHHVAVTRQGDIVDDLRMMKKHAMTGNCIWACCGQYDEAMGQAGRVAEAVKKAKFGKKAKPTEAKNTDPLGIR